MTSRINGIDTIMKQKLLINLLSITLMTSPVFACINGEREEIKIDYHSTVIPLTNDNIYIAISDENLPYGVAIPEQEKQSLEKNIVELEQSYQQTKDLDDLSDKGVLLMYLGRYQQAKDIFLQIEKIEPNRYSTASNLGTTYELLGDNKNALKWIKKAVEINPTSHNNSEWIHVNILEAKLEAKEKGEQFYSTKNILKTNFGDKPLPISTLSIYELYNLRGQLFYQLTERVNFVKPKNKIMAELLFALADIDYILEKYQSASYNYQLAKEYGYQGQYLQIRSEDAKKRATKQEEEKRRKKLLEQVGFFAIALLVISAIIALMVWIRRKIITFNETAKIVMGWLFLVVLVGTLIAFMFFMFVISLFLF